MCLAPSGQGGGEGQGFKPKVMLSVEEIVWIREGCRYIYLLP